MMGAGLRWAGWLVLAVAVTAGAQETGKPERPLPDIPALMHEVEAKQRAAEEARKDYIFHAVVTEVEVDGKGSPKKTEVKEYDDFWIKGVPVERLVKKDGRELTADEAKKESERIDKEAAKASERRAKEDAKGKETDPRGNDEVTVSRLLELGSFTNARRVQMAGRDTIAVDYTGDPKAKTKNRFEGVIRDMAGTVWVDEQDKAISRIEGRFVDSFKVGGGLMASIREGTNFNLQMTKVNGEVWLPARVEGKGEARVLLFFKFNGSLTAAYSDYRKFKTSAAIVGVGVVKE
ncbi:hypothetical protein [Granulicella aggregans]|jgi:histone H3/H4|uniref:hypothetical protein n=1 Tax=Granulicella aggregans TaxID=474949 RepID=UPI0021DF5577|nr:hypothetical protein [Granulicella aggregans]